jgi:hypothetical protein
MNREDTVTYEEHGQYAAFEMITGEYGVHSQPTGLTFPARSFGEARRMATALSTEQAALES